MTTGNTSTWFGDPYNRVEKTWSGTDGRGRENGYSSSHLRIRSIKPTSEEFISGSWVPTGPTWHTNMLPSIPPGMIVPTGGDYLKALSKVVDQLRDSDLNLAQVIAESNQTLSLLTGSLGALLNGFRYAVKGRPDLALRSMGRVASGNLDDVAKRLRGKDVADTWVAISFGWRPLLSDIYAALELLHKTQERCRVAYRGRTKVQDDVVVTASGLVAHRELEIAYKVRVSRTASLFESLGFTDPASLAWELLPWSFAVDWVVPVGTYLSTFNALAGLDGVVVTTTYKSWRAEWDGSTYYASPSLRYTGAQFTASAVNLTREVSSFLDIPAPTVKRFEKIFSQEHLALGASLVTQLVSARNRTGV